MRRIIITALIALTALGGVASADRYHGDRYRRDNGGVRVDRGHRNYRPAPSYRYSRSYQRPNYRNVYRPRVRIVRQPIYVQRPVIRYRYTNYYQQPNLLVENYPAKPGYLWVRGSWQWNGYEWIWQPGHYQPDPSYDQYYNGGYQQPTGYYDANGNWIDTSGGIYNY